MIAISASLGRKASSHEAGAGQVRFSYSRHGFIAFRYFLCMLDVIALSLRFMHGLRHAMLLPEFVYTGSLSHICHSSGWFVKYFTASPFCLPASFIVYLTPDYLLAHDHAHMPSRASSPRPKDAAAATPLAYMPLSPPQSNAYFCLAFMRDIFSTPPLPRKNIFADIRFDVDKSIMLLPTATRCHCYHSY